MRLNGKVLQYVPEEMKTPEVCLEAVKSNFYAIKDIRREERTVKIYLGVLMSIIKSGLQVC